MQGNRSFKKLEHGQYKRDGNRPLILINTASAVALKFVRMAAIKLGIKKEGLTIETLKEILQDETLTEDELKSILISVQLLIDLIIDYQSEQELKINNEDNLKEAA